MSFLHLVGVKSLAKLVLGIQCLVLPVPGQRQLTSLLIQIAHRERQRKKQLGGHEQGRQNNRWM